MGLRACRMYDSFYTIILTTSAVSSTNLGLILWIPCPQTNTPTENIETPSTFPQPSRHRFWKDRLGNTGDLSCLEHATEPSPPRSADRSSAADTPPSGFPAAGLWKAPLDCSFYPRAGGALTTARPPLSLLTSLHWCFLHLWEFFPTCPVSPSVNGLLCQPVLSHTPPS